MGAVMLPLAPMSVPAWVLIVTPVDPEAVDDGFMTVCGQTQGTRARAWHRSSVESPSPEEGR